MTFGKNIAGIIRDRFETADVFEIALKSGIKIVSERWFPVTAGEYCGKTKTITINENAPVSREKIVAHELGHYFARSFENGAVFDEEIFCDAFADEILRFGMNELGNDER